jgi:hypothetical protein
MGLDFVQVFTPCFSSSSNPIVFPAAKFNMNSQTLIETAQRLVADTIPTLDTY